MKYYATFGMLCGCKRDVARVAGKVGGLTDCVFTGLCGALPEAKGKGGGMQVAYSKANSGMKKVSIFLVVAAMIAAGCRSDNSDRIEAYKEIFFPIIIIFSVIFAIYLIFKIEEYRSKRSYEKSREKYLEHLEIFKQQAEKIPVDLNKCKIKQKTHYHQKNRQKGYATVFDAYDAYKSNKPVYDTKERSTCMVTYKTKIGHIPYTFHEYIEKDEFTVRVMFAKRKKTWIYVDKKDIKNYYFDLEFLDKW